MNNCRYKKILQFYLDGSSKSGDFKGLEKHLKTCLECQIQLAELEELNSAALDIIDEAPDKEYWGSFPNRVRNRITARSIEPDAFIRRRRTPWLAAFRMASVLVALIFIVGSSILLLNGGISILNNSVQTVDKPPTADGQIIAPPPETNTRQKTLNQANKVPSSVASLSLERDAAFRQEFNLKNDGGAGLIRRQAAPRIRPANIEISDLSDRLRNARVAQLANPQLEDEVSSYSPILASYLADIDPSFHLKNSFVNQRLLAGLNDRPRSGFNGAYLGLGFEYNRLSLDGGKVSPANETQSTWGYTSLSTDTSKSAEINQYYLELNLMKSK